jgi:NADP-dependent 3-hydroxy acid dehydrogenase YdfG
MTTSPRVALVTGASSGIDHAAALELSRRGFTVCAGARRVDRMEGRSSPSPVPRPCADRGRDTRRDPARDSC